ncbi:MAG TPA: dephospho-CoA kinase [Bacteroidota bacterium]|nr:dephospho-CoA kinase [Bacteroidota bacterium]
MPSERVPLVGVTGGIGSGKSEVCRILSRLGRTVIAADELARGLTERDASVREEIAREFGAEIFGPSGELRRGELARVVFASPPRLRALNAIVHPGVFRAIETALARLPAASRSPYAVVEAALVFESGMDERLDATILVRAPEELRMERVMSRSALSRDEVNARMRAQISPQAAARRADFVIDNAGTPADLEPRVVFVDRVLALRFGPKRP